MRFYEPTTGYDFMYFRRMRGKPRKVKNYVRRQARANAWADLMPRKPLGDRVARRSA